MTAPTAYPLAWPHGWPRTSPASREKWPAQVTLPAALADLAGEMRRMGITNVVLSSNVTLGMNNAPDPGVVAYGLRGGKQQIAIPCDRWTTVAANVRAITKTIEAMRGMERWGAKHMITAMFQGFVVLPAPGRQPWRAVLGFQADGHPTRDEIETKRRTLARQHHPDRGGDPARMAEINEAADEALKEMSR